jgi:hypothetical protein
MTDERLQEAEDRVKELEAICAVASEALRSAGRTITLESGLGRLSIPTERHVAQILSMAKINRALLAIHPELAEKLEPGDLERILRSGQDPLHR